MIWEHSPRVPNAILVDRVQDMAAVLWFALTDSVFGWLLEAMLTTILPFFLLGAVLAGQTSLGSPMPSKIERSSPAGRWVSTAHTLVRLLAPTMIVAVLVMTEHPGIDLPIIVMAILLPTSACAAWFWMMSRGLSAVLEASGITWRDMLVIGSGMTMLFAALAGGVSPEGSALLALGLVIALGAAVTGIRSAATTVLQSLAHGGARFAKLLLAIATVGLILASLDRSGSTIDLAKILAGAAGEARLPLLVFSACVSIALGAVMPALAAYLIVAALVGPALRTVGITDLTIHLFVLFACVGGLTIKNGGISSSRETIGAGLAMVGVGFAFASNPELLLVPKALASVGRPDHMVGPLILAWAIIRTGCMLYLLAMATEGFRRDRSGLANSAFCIVAALASVAGHPMVHGPGMFVGALIIMSSRGLVERRPKPI